MLRTVQRVLKALHGQKIIFYLTILLSAFINIFFIIYIDIVKRLINAATQMHIDKVLHLIGLAALVLLVDIFLNRYSIIWKKRLYIASLATLRIGFFKKMNTISLPVLEKYMNADLITRFVDDVVAISNFVSNALVNVISSLILFVIFFVYILLNEWKLIFPLLVLLPVTKFFVAWKGAMLQTEIKRFQAEKSTLYTIAKDIFDYMMNIKSYASEAFFERKYAGQESRLLAHEIKANLYSNQMWIMGIIVYYIVYLFFYGVGGFLALKGYIDFGLVVGLFLIIDKLVDLLMGIPKMFASIYEISPKVDRVMEIFDLPEPVESMESANSEVIATSFRETAAHGKSTADVLEIRNLSFAYEHGKDVLKDINLQIKYGERVAIVGESGCGKSTILKLLTGYDDSYRGEIAILGKEMHEWPKKEVRKYMSYSPQEPFLLSKTIMENFALFDESITEGKLQEYAKIVELDREIEAFEDRYNTLLKNGGENLSGGQKQRLGLMTGLLKKSIIYLIDEGFSALDPQMIKKVLTNTFDCIKETVVVVTHKLDEDIMTKFDRIVVMEDGRIVGIGSHQDLLTNQVYKILFEKSEQEI